MFEFKTKKPEESSSNWKPWHTDWDAITSNHSEDDAINDKDKYRYNRKGFLEDDKSSDDSILTLADNNHPMQHADAPVSIIAVVPKAVQLGISNSTLTL
ncbi:hypothetical protein Tco_1481776 [Tanacetum coccineum]